MEKSPKKISTVFIRYLARLGFGVLVDWTGCGRMEKGWCKLIRMQKEMPRSGGAGDTRTARKKGRKDNEYDVNFKAD